jgi:hypothetical protein
MKEKYENILRELQPLKIIEKQLMTMEEQGNKGPEVLPMHYEFLSSIIKLLEELKEDIKNKMAS